LPVPEETPHQTKKHEKQPVPKKLKFYDQIKRNPGLINRFINNPNSLKQYLSKDKKEANQALIDFIKNKKREAWAKKGIKKLKRDLNSGKFSMPEKSLGGANHFRKKYFLNMPASAIWDLGKILLKFF